MPFYCEVCGTKITDGFTFCRSCGHNNAEAIAKAQEKAAHQNDDKAESSFLESYINNKKTETVIAQECTTTENNNADEYIDDYIDDYSNEEELDLSDIEVDMTVTREEEEEVSSSRGLTEEEEKAAEEYYDEEFKNIETSEDISETVEYSNIDRSQEVKPISRAVRRRRIIEDDAEKEFETETRKSKNGFGTYAQSEELFADEIVSERKYDNIEINDNQGIDGPAEGRRQTSNKRRERRKKEKIFDETKHYKLKHAEVADMDSEENKGYDGYYENIEPIDADEIHRKKIDPKTVALILGMIAFIIAMIAIVVNIVT